MPDVVSSSRMDPGGPIPQAPKSPVPWMTWVWIAFLVLVVVLTVVGFVLMSMT